jgi:hypothetical protein
VSALSRDDAWNYSRAALLTEGSLRCIQTVYGTASMALCRTHVLCTRKYFRAYATHKRTKLRTYIVLNFCSHVGGLTS